MKLSDEQINQLISELVAFEPSLKDREPELTEMVTRLIEARPEIIFDETFRSRLREEVLLLAKERSAAGTRTNFIFNLKAMFNLKKISYGAAGTAVLILLIVPAVFLLLSRQNLIGSLSRTGRQLAFETNISKVAGGAFGLLSANSAAAPTAGKDAAAVTMGSGSASGIVGNLGRGGGGGGVAAAAPILKMMPPYEATIYRYVYQGADLSSLADKLDVLKQVKGAAVNVDMNNLVQGLNFGLSDIGSFSDLSLQNISLVQKGDNGYVISVMPDEGAISISQNWPTWPQAKCGSDQACYDNQRVKPEDIPSDSELISITDAFLAEHNIDKTNFGDPEVSPGYNFRVMYEASADKANFYFPDSIDVIYPIKVDGKFVYDEWNGTKLGMTVSVQVKQKRVSNLYNLTTQNYQASAYDMETDAKKILTYAEQGGVNNMQYGDGAKTADLALGDPQLVYTKYYSYKDNLSEELLVPALYFPIKELPKDPNFYRKGIIVPLAKTILEERQAQPGPNIYGGPASSGSAGGTSVGSSGSMEIAPPQPQPAQAPLIQPGIK